MPNYLIQTVGQNDTISTKKSFYCHRSPREAFLGYYCTAPKVSGQYNLKRRLFDELNLLFPHVICHLIELNTTGNSAMAAEAGSVLSWEWAQFKQPEVMESVVSSASEEWNSKKVFRCSRDGAQKQKLWAISYKTYQEGAQGF